MNFTQEEQVVARDITSTAEKLNKLMIDADRLNLTVDVTPTKLRRTGGKEIRQIMVKVRAELSITDLKEVKGNR